MPIYLNERDRRLDRTHRGEEERARKAVTEGGGPLVKGPSMKYIPARAYPRKDAQKRTW